MTEFRVFSYRRALFALLLLALALAAAARSAAPSSAQAPVQSSQSAAAPTDFLTTGISVAFMDTARAEALGHSWVKVYDPPSTREPINVLYRYDINSNTANNFTWHLRSEVRRFGDNIDAYEIGNEPNLANEWRGPADATSYAAALCVAYREIKLYDPSALVVSAGLAPVGRIEGIFNGKLGHDGRNQDDREWIDEFLAAGGHNCADAIGYHPMGFRADFDAAPDVSTGDPDSDCNNGFCFRTVEKFREKMLERQIDMPIWATEVGWLVEPPAECLRTLTWFEREWQIVSAEKRLTNTVGAVTYATQNYPWMDILFVWNLNFDDAPWYDTCNQMRYYSQAIAVEVPLRKLFMPIIKSQ